MDFDSRIFSICDMARCLQATYTVVSFHIGIAIGGLPEFIMYPIGAILLGRKLLHDWNPSTHRHLRLRSPQLGLFSLVA